MVHGWWRQWRLCVAREAARALATTGNELSGPLLLKFSHVVHQRLHASQRPGVVDRVVEQLGFGDMALLHRGDAAERPFPLAPQPLEGQTRDVDPPGRG